MSGPISPPLTGNEALRADLRPASWPSWVLAHPDLGPAAAAERIGSRR
jgi:hypothetical protein